MIRKLPRHGQNGVVLVPAALRARARRLHSRLGTKRKMSQILAANDHTVDALLDYGELRADVIARIDQALTDLGI